MTSAVDRFELRITIDPSDIDQLGHVNNVVYLRWVQDAAVDLTKLLWVVIRHEIDYKQPAFLGDEIIACTWVGTATRLTFERHMELLRASDRSVLARASTVWYPINPQTGKPTAGPRLMRQVKRESSLDVPGQLRTSEDAESWEDLSFLESVAKSN